jgi:DNA-binding NtrC family response regulator
VSSKELKKAGRPNLVVLVDDEPALLVVLERLLGLRGFRVLPVASVKRARAVLARWRVSVVVLDLHLPGEGGANLIDEIRSAYPATSIVLFSGDPDVGRRAKELGVPFVEKGAPGSFDELARILRRLVGLDAATD